MKRWLFSSEISNRVTCLLYFIDKAVIITNKTKKQTNMSKELELYILLVEVSDGTIPL